MRHNGMIVILSSPSGAGKSTLSRMLRADKAMDIGISVSATTRAKRPSEQDGKDYHFVSEAKFKQLIAEQAFVEWAEVHGAHYGTLRQNVDAVLAGGRDIVFDIDYQGAAQMRKARPHDVVSVFILPPSMRDLRARLQARAENSAQDLALRLGNAKREMRHWNSYDYLLVNENLERSFSALKAIITAERLKRRRLPAAKSLIQALTAED